MGKDRGSKSDNFALGTGTRAKLSRRSGKGGGPEIIVKTVLAIRVPGTLVHPPMMRC
jgi:hypothetical protein